MCYEALRNGDAVEQPLRDVLRAEARDAFATGLAAAVVVAAVLFGRGFDPAATLPFAVGAVPLGMALHLAVLVAGTVVLRARQGPVDGSEPAA